MFQMTSGNQQGEIFVSGNGALQLKTARIGNSRIANYSDVLFSQNLGHVDAADTYQTFATGTYAGVEMFYDTASSRGIRFITASANQTASTPFTPSYPVTISGSGNVTMTNNVSITNNVTAGNVVLSPAGIIASSATNENIILTPHGSGEVYSTKSYKAVGNGSNGNGSAYFAGTAASNLARFGPSRILNYSDTLIARNLDAVAGADTYQTLYTGGYAGQEFFYDGALTSYGVRWYTSRRRHSHRRR
jgi:hypothetical protein